MNFKLKCGSLALVFFIFNSFLASVYAEETEDVIHYKLGAGDQLEIRVFNQDDLTGEYMINGAGNISMPLIGTVNAKNSTVKELETRLVEKLRPDYLLNPRVSIQVLNYRPYYIIGEVKSPASYPYVSGMTFLNAVAIASGFTYRAKRGHALVIRANNSKQEEAEMNMDRHVMPGDIIKIEERLF